MSLFSSQNLKKNTEKFPFLIPQWHRIKEKQKRWKKNCTVQGDKGLYSICKSYYLQLGQDPLSSTFWMKSNKQPRTELTVLTVYPVTSPCIWLHFPSKRRHSTLLRPPQFHGMFGKGPCRPWRTSISKAGEGDSGTSCKQPNTQITPLI